MFILSYMTYLTGNETWLNNIRGLFYGSSRDRLKEIIPN